MFSHQRASTNNGLLLLPKTSLKLFSVVWCYGWKWIAIRKNEAKLFKFFQRVDIKSILNGHGLFSLNEIKLIRCFRSLDTMWGLDKVSYR